MMDKRIEILPATKRLKQVIREHAGPWMELERGPVACFEGRIGVLVGNKAGTHTRWVEADQVREVKLTPPACCIVDREVE